MYIEEIHWMIKYQSTNKNFDESINRLKEAGGGVKKILQNS